jgi:hypothetical protein
VGKGGVADRFGPWLGARVTDRQECGGDEYGDGNGAHHG